MKPHLPVLSSSAFHVVRHTLVTDSSRSLSLQLREGRKCSPHLSSTVAHQVLTSCPRMNIFPVMDSVFVLGDGEEFCFLQENLAPRDRVKPGPLYEKKIKNMLHSHRLLWVGLLFSPQQFLSLRDRGTGGKKRCESFHAFSLFTCFTPKAHGT